MRFLSVYIVLILLLCVSAYGQDPGDPVLTCDASQDFQIRWRGEADWLPVVSSEIVYSGGPVGSHRWVTWGNSNIEEIWEGMLPDGTTKMQATFSIPVLLPEPPDPVWWTYYQFRYRCRVYAGTAYERASSWSTPGKVYVITLDLTGEPVASDG